MASHERKTALDFEAQAIALAEHIGRIVGTIEGTAESWLKDPELADQLTRVRDGATQMLEGLKQSQKKKTAPARPRRAAKPDLAHAPGKKRRKPAPSLKGVKKSDERIPKLRTAAAVRQRRKSYA